MKFYKYQGTGNDFVMIDNRDLQFEQSNQKLIATLCDRRFGIGGDGLILLENHDSLDFKMIYFNADGNQSSMCGNGGRCIVAFAKRLAIIDNSAIFEAIDGIHEAIITDRNIVSLKMSDVFDIEKKDDHYFLNTGSPHHVEFCNDLKNTDINSKGSFIRYSEKYLPDGTNVNFVSKINQDTFAIRTYERGVENETLSCGTGATAVAVAMHFSKNTTANVINILVEGGKLQVCFKNNAKKYFDIYLTGAADFVFEGTIDNFKN